VSASLAAPGHLGLLLRHEARLIWRGSLFGGRHGWALLLGAAVLLHAIGYGVALGFTRVHLSPSDQVLSATLALLFVGGLMLAQAVQRASELLDDRTDLSWLLSTPVPPRHVLAVRLLAVSGGVSLYWLLLLVPLANGMLFLGRPDLLGVYPMLLVLALLVTSCGFAVTFILLRFCDVRRARALANGFATLVGATVFLGGQTRSLMPADVSDRFWRSFAPANEAAARGLQWLPAHALMGEWAPVVLLLGLAILCAVAVSWGLQAWFAAGAQAVVGNGAGERVNERADRRPFVQGRFRNLLTKEVRLLHRYPGLAGLAFYYTIYLVPAVVAIARGATMHGQDTAGARLLGVAPVLTSGELARLFVSVTMMGDEAAELVRTAPVRAGETRAAKLAAAGLGVISILGLPVIGLGISLPQAVPAMLAGMFGNIFCNLLLGLWRPAPIRRTDLRRDRKGWGGLVNLVGFLFSGAWSIATWKMLQGSALALVPAALAVIGLWLCRPRQAEE
jgi:ABC-2 type transport system permease protein